MVQLVDSDIRTREVLHWEGLHLFHYDSSSCSEKVRIVLNIKRLAWTSHYIDLDTDENYEEWYLGINPRGLVPTLVHDGQVHIESNDIIRHIESSFPEPKLIPVGSEEKIRQLLAAEDELHLDLRTLTFGLLITEDEPPKSETSLAKYEQGGSGTVGGVADDHKQKELKFWRDAGEHGITPDKIRVSAKNFFVALNELESTLADRMYLLGNQYSLLDIAWYIYINRLLSIGYPLEELHPRMSRWFTRLNQLPEWSSQIPEHDRVPTQKTDSAYAELLERKQIFRKITLL